MVAYLFKLKFRRLDKFSRGPTSNMYNYLITFLPTSITAILLSIVVTWICLKIVCYSNPSFLSFLFISSGKSSTNARLLGGLALSSSILVAMSSVLIFYPQTISSIEKKSYLLAMSSILLVTFYGYIDDKFEVRVRFKLALQLISILSFAFFSSSMLSHQYPTLAFIFSSILGLALVNGTNLLDGLDTLSVKLGVSSSLAFLYLGVIAHSPATIYLSLILISALSVFYFFNREPAKIYMGEIGGSIIGLTYFIQSILCFSSLKEHYSFTSTLSLVLIASIFPIIELAISFTRRIFFKKSPFRGDRLHLHYIIKNKYNLSASTTSNYLGVGSILILGLGFLISKSLGPAWALTIMTTVSLQIYLSVCLKEWKSHFENKEAEHLFLIFEGKTINVIDSSQFGSLDISLNNTENKNSSKKKSA